MFSILLILFSIPSLNADLEFWIALINLQSWKWWNYVLVGVGVILFFNAMYNFYCRFNTEYSEDKNDILPQLTTNRFVKFVQNLYGRESVKQILMLMALPFMFFGLMAITLGPFLFFLWSIEWLFNIKFLD